MLPWFVQIPTWHKVMSPRHKLIEPRGQFKWPFRDFWHVLEDLQLVQAFKKIFTVHLVSTVKSNLLEKFAHFFLKYFEADIIWKASFTGKSLLTDSMKGLTRKWWKVAKLYSNLWQMQALSYFQFNLNIPALREGTNLNSAIDQW